MNKEVIYHSKTIRERRNKSKIQNLLTAISIVILKILVAVVMWVILTAAFFVL